MTIEEKIQAYKSVFQGRSAELVLEDLEQQCFANQPSWNPNVDKPIESVFYNEGRRSVLLYIAANITADLDKIREIRQESRHESDFV